MGKRVRKFGIKYKASDKPNKWRYFQGFYVSGGRGRIKNSYEKVDAVALSWQQSQHVLAEIRRRYDATIYFRLIKTDRIIIYEIPVSRFELMEL